MESGYNSVTFNRCKTDEISLSEATDFLGLESELGESWAKKDDLKKRKNSLTRDLEKLKKTKGDSEESDEPDINSGEGKESHELRMEASAPTDNNNKARDETNTGQTRRSNSPPADEHLTEAKSAKSASPQPQGSVEQGEANLIPTSADIDVGDGAFAAAEDDSSAINLDLPDDSRSNTLAADAEEMEAQMKEAVAGVEPSKQSEVEA